jgi:hypothetical protein
MAMKVKSIQAKGIREKTPSAESVLAQKFVEVPTGAGFLNHSRKTRFMLVTHKSACVCRNLGGTTEVFVPLSDEDYFFWKKN